MVLRVGTPKVGQMSKCKTKQNNVIKHNTTIKQRKINNYSKQSSMLSVDIAITNSNNTMLLADRRKQPLKSLRYSDYKFPIHKESIIVY